MPTALITGGTTGIGRATAELLHARGHQVTITGQKSGREAMRTNIPFERFGSGQEVAEAVAFLASDAADHTTGQDIAVAGGYGLGA